MKISGIFFAFAMMMALVSADYQYATCILQPVGNSGVSGTILLSGQILGPKSRDNLRQLSAVNADPTRITFTPNILGLQDNTNYGLTVRVNGDINSATSAGDVFKAASAEYTCASTPGSLGNTTKAGAPISTDLLYMIGEDSIIGRTIVLSAQPEFCNTTASTAALAQCVIGLGNTAFIPENSGVGPFTGNNIANYQAANADPSQFAICNLAPINNSAVTGVVFIELIAGGNITVTAQVNGLAVDSTHGIHIHGFGDIILNNGTSVGGHWKNATQQHSLPPNTTRELGDFGNICTYSGGVAYYKYSTNYVGNQASLPNFVGRSFVIHAIRDGGSGVTNYGARIAQCVIGLGTSTSHQTIPQTVTFPAEPICPVANGTTTTGATTTGTTDTTGTTTGSASTVVPALLLIISLISMLLL